MNKKRLIILSICIILFLFSGCSSEQNEAQSNSEAFTITDDLGREIVIKETARIGIASGSLTECWLLAGGQPVAVTQDVLDERDFDLSSNVINLGALNAPSMETILEADLDLLILVSSLPPHLKMKDTLDESGVPTAYLNVENFDDYLHLLDIFTTLTGKRDLYEKHGLAIADDVKQTLASSKQTNNPSVLLLRSSSRGIEVRNGETMVGQMLNELGCVNIADQEGFSLDELSLESVKTANPDYIFIVCMGEEDEAKAQLDYQLASNPIWQELGAVKNNRCIYLEKELFHYKPNVRWGDSYEALAEILSTH